MLHFPYTIRNTGKAAKTCLTCADSGENCGGNEEIFPPPRTLIHPRLDRERKVVKFKEFMPLNSPATLAGKQTAYSLLVK